MRVIPGQQIFVEFSNTARWFIRGLYINDQIKRSNNNNSNNNDNDNDKN